MLFHISLKSCKTHKVLSLQKVNRIYIFIYIFGGCIVIVQFTTVSACHKHITHTNTHKLITVSVVQLSTRQWNMNSYIGESIDRSNTTGLNVIPLSTTSQNHHTHPCTTITDKFA